MAGPHDADPANLLTAVEARSVIERGELTCETYVQTCLERIADRDPQIGAWQHLDRGVALACARQFDANAANRSGALGGIPVGVKDIIDVVGMPTAYGSPIYTSAPNATIDAASVAILRYQGAIPLGKTVSTELAGAYPAGTRNPNSPAHTPGGSSSGSAAAVADGHVPLALGTQTAGSVIRPAAYCGVFGFKPTRGIAPLTGLKVQSETLDTLGVFARSADDCALWWAAMTNTRYRALDHNSIGALRIARIRNLDEFASDAMRDAVGRAAQVFSAAGASVNDLSLPAPLEKIHQVQAVIQRFEAARAYTAEHRQHRGQLSSTILEQLDLGAAISFADYRTAMAEADAARRSASQLFLDYDAWLMPSAPGAAPQGLASTGDPLFNRLASILQSPAMNVPAFSDAQRLPLGIQLIAPRYADMKLLSISHWAYRALASRQQ